MTTRARRFRARSASRSLASDDGRRRAPERTAGSAATTFPVGPVLRWAASISTIVAALLVALRGSSRLTATGFLLFVVASLCWIAASLMGDRDPLLLQNVVLLAINLFGLVRWGRAARGAG